MKGLRSSYSASTEGDRYSVTEVVTVTLKRVKIGEKVVTVAF